MTAPAGRRGEVADLARLVRDIPDFPKPGVTFKDITPLLGDVDAFRFTVDAIADHFSGYDVDRVLGIEARGFIAAAPTGAIPPRPRKKKR